MLEIERLHHFAWKCKDVDETIAFYEGILGLPLVHTIELDHVPSTGEYAPYKHIFFQMLDGSCIAFFEMGDGKGASTDCDDWIVHFGMKLADVKAVIEAKEMLEKNGIDVIGPTDHGFITSIYFFDPNGLRLELTCDTSDILK